MKILSFILGLCIGFFIASSLYFIFHDTRKDRYINLIFNVCHQCELPVYYTIDVNVPEWSRQDIINAFEYWNYYGEHRMFEYLGVSDENIGKFGGKGLVSVIYRDDNTCEFLGWHKPNSVEIISGCFGSSYIALNGCLFNDYPQYFSTTMRHEIGHALGLNHNKDRGSLMYPEVLGKNVDISEKEFEAIKLYY